VVGWFFRSSPVLIRDHFVGKGSSNGGNQLELDDGPAKFQFFIAINGEQSGM
jgi:hypothetical protein